MCVQVHVNAFYFKDNHKNIIVSYLLAHETQIIQTEKQEEPES